MSLSAQIFGRDSFIHRATNILGLGIPTWLDKKFGPQSVDTSPTIPTVQDSAYGNPIPRFYGTIGAAGNVIWLKGGKLDVTVKKKKSGGKGGGSSPAQTTYSYFATFALSLGEGPIVGIRRIWCADKLIYNAGSDDLETIIASNNAAKGWKLYLGTDDQMPDPDIQADKGVDNTPAYRGLAYIKFKKFALKNYGDSLAGSQFKIELVSNKTDIVYANTSSLGFVFNGADIDYLNGTYYAVATQLTNNLITSFDGKSWRQSTISDGKLFYSMRSNGSRIVALSNDGFVYHSTGLAWSSSPLPVVGDFDVLYWSGAKFCAISSGTTKVMTSEDGVTWTAGAMPAARVWRDVVWNGSIFCAVASDSNFGAISSDGLTWTSVDLGIALGLHGIAWNGSEFLAIVMGGAHFAKSADGSIWSSVDSPSANQWSSVDYGVNGFVMLSRDGFIANSYDGVSWSVDTCPSENWSRLLLQGTAFYSICPGVVSLYGFFRVEPDNPMLSDVIRREVSLSSLLGDSDIDTSLINDQVRGYKVGGGSIRDAIENLRAAYPFDARMHGYRLQFVPRGQVSAVSIPWEDLAASDGEEIGDSLPYDREMDTQLPVKVTAKGISADREYADSSQSYERIGTMAVNSQSLDLGLVLSDDELAQIAEMACESAWMERQPFSFSLPPTYQMLEPADVVTANPKFGVFDIRLTEVSTEANGIVTCKGFPNSAGLYVRTAVGAPVPVPDGTVPLAGPSLFIPLDIPVVDETLQNAPGFVGSMTGYTDGWPGAVAVRSADGGQTWNDLQGYLGKATIGNARGTLSANACTLIEQRTLTVDMLSGELESITREQMLIGQNYAAYGADGRWEIVRFQNAALQGDGSYILRGFVRGDRGTEWATGTHVAGDYFILLDDPDNAFIGMAVGSIGVPATYRGITSGDSIDNASDVPFTYKGVNLECLAPVSARGTRDTSSNFTGTFNRRTRLSSSWWANGVVGPIGEASEAYEIDVMSGSTVKRTISVTSPAWSYSAANQTSDFGSPQSSITFRIYQLSATVGRGYPLEVTL